VSMESSTETPGILARSLIGLAASVLAAVPLAIVFSLHGFVTSTAQDSAIGIFLGTAAVVIGALIVSAASGLVFGIPAYLLAVRTNAPRVVVLVVVAALAGVLVREWWLDGVGSALLFAFFGAYSGAAFWYGADGWSREP